MEVGETLGQSLWGHCGYNVQDDILWTPDSWHLPTGLLLGLAQVTLWWEDFVCLFVFKTGFLCVVLAVPELTL